MKNSVIHSDISIAELLRDWPETIPVFQRYQMACVGCTMSDFETVRSAAEVYHLPLEQFLQDLLSAAASDKKS